MCSYPDVLAHRENPALSLSHQSREQSAPAEFNRLIVHVNGSSSSLYKFSLVFDQIKIDLTQGIDDRIMFSSI
ncbi:hypothetical protein SAMN06265784_10898 [Paraburkholderia susongensis]|uniref:Uncharacterized protein n=1 Tax=Paraburkholderia susongensis TaxID=1515439 RepID=A0A1X7LRV7_9BURK|nr:hypothetical protein SAMN06265784_10898 [Paraburkholderia susongensis]